MLVCNLCQKGIRKIAYSRHKKGSSGASEWPLRAPIYKKTQKPNLHTYKGMKFCTKCLRIVKAAEWAKPKKTKDIPVKTSVETPAAT